MRIRPIPAMVSMAVAIVAAPALAADAPAAMYMNTGELKWGDAATIEQLLGHTIFLELTVKARPKWRQDEAMLERLGL